MCCPNSLHPQVLDELRAEEDADQHRRHPGDQDLAHQSSSVERLGHRLEAGRARALDEDRVARLELGGEQLGRLLRVADQLVGVVVAGRLPDADQHVDALGAGVRADLAVVAGGAGAELGHLAEHGDAALRPAATRGGRAPRASTPGWRCSSRSPGRSRLQARGARPGSGRSLCSQRGRPSPRAARRAPRRRRSPPGRWSGCGARRTGSGSGRDPAGVTISASVTPSSTVASTASTSPPGPKRSRRGARQVRLQLAGLDRDDRGAVGRQRSEHLRLRRRDRLDRAEQLDVDRADVGDHRHVGLGDRRQLGDLARAPHRHLQHQQARSSAGASSIVSGSPISVLRFSRLACTRPGSSARAMSLTEVLPTEPVTPTTRAPSSRRQARASACSAASGSSTAKTHPSRSCSVRYPARGDPNAAPTTTPQAPGVDRRRGELGRRRASRRAGRRRGRRARPRPESIDGPRRRTGRAPGQDLGPDRRRDLLRGEVHPGPRGRACTPAACAAPRGRPRGRRRGPCARPRTPGPARAPCRRSPPCRRAAPARAPARSPRAGRARPRPSAPPSAPADDFGDDRLGVLGAGVVGGDRPRGRSSSAPALPIFGRLSRSRSPPAPKTEISRPAGEPPRRPQHVLQRVGRVRVVDQHRERLPLVDRLEAPRRRRGACASAAAAASGSTPSAIAAANAPSAFATLKSPGSPVRTHHSPPAGRSCRRSSRSARRRRGHGERGARGVEGDVVGGEVGLARPRRRR